MLSPRSLFAQANSGGEASGLSRRKNHLFKGRILRGVYPWAKRRTQNDKGLYSLINKRVTITNAIESVSLSNNYIEGLTTFLPTGPFYLNIRGSRSKKFGGLDTNKMEGPGRCKDPSIFTLFAVEFIFLLAANIHRPWPATRKKVTTKHTGFFN